MTSPPDGVRGTAVAVLLEAIERQRWPGNVAPTPLQSIALVSANPQTRMKGNASMHCIPLGNRGRRLAEHVELSEPSPETLVGDLFSLTADSGAGLDDAGDISGWLRMREDIRRLTH